MAQNGAARRKQRIDESMELNLTPMMNLISILIPVLLISTVFVEMAVLNVSTPSIGSDSASKKPEKPPLNLKLIISDNGYLLTGNDDALAGQGMALALVQRKVSCQRYVDSTPPPRARNKQAGPCPDETTEKNFWVYDKTALVERLVQLKTSHPTERRIIISAQEQVEYEAITDAMDITRAKKVTDTQTQELFDEVVISPTP